MNTSLNRLFEMCLLVGGVWVVDELLKLWMKQSNAIVLNKGIAFGIFDDKPLMLVLGILCIWLLLVWWIEFNKLKWWGWGFITAGGLSNVIDRWRHGGVIDFIYYPVVNIYGNLADIVIVVGGVILFWSFIREKS